jgi:long-chain acyl-CoA synthetase
MPTDHSSVSKPGTLCEAFQATAAKYPDAIALRLVGGAATITWRQYRQRVEAIASGLAKLGVGPGDTVSLMLTNRPEFHLCDTAVLHTGATPFSIYNTNPPELIGYLFDNADNRVVICEKQFLPVVLTARNCGGKVEHVICVDGTEDGVITLAQLESDPATDFDFETAWRSVKPDDVLTLVYTSGTTGPPKGVELTHRNFIVNAQIIDELGGAWPADRVISYLPDAHAANRWFTHYLSMLYGVQVSDLVDPKQLINALIEARPTLLLGVPRVWIKLKSGLESAVSAESTVNRALVNWALGVGRKTARAASDGGRVGVADRIRHMAADRLVLSKLRARLGLDQVRSAASGAAPIPVEVHEFILSLGISLYEGYGMTECTAVATINRPGRMRIGTVGQAVPGSQVRLADDGEVLIRGANVMRGYRKDPEKTAATIDSEHWLHTGDIGILDADGYLSIVDRRKELIINEAGKNMSPANIENAIAANTPLAGPSAVIGDRRPYNTALITLDPDMLAIFAEKHGLAGQSLAQLAVHPAVRATVEEGIEAANRTLSRVEQIKKFTILPNPWEPGSEHLTPTNKLKRKLINASYADEIEAMYSTS